MSRIYFVCPDISIPAGGIKQLYRQVDVLNKHDYEAYVVHGHKYFRVNWFKNNTPVVWHPLVKELDTKVHTNLKSKIKALVKRVVSNRPKYDKSLTNEKLQLKEDDIVVLPEFYGRAINNVFQNHKTIVYNQNCYYTFRGYGIPDGTESESIYEQERLLGVIVASTDAVSYMKSFLENKPIYRVKYGVDQKLFSYNSKKRKQIAFMPRKLREDSEQILNILNIKGILNGWEVVPIQGKNEQQVAEILKKSAIFLSFNHREGFGMPPTEAMACGCIVVGYMGNGGKEYFKEDFSYPIEDRNVQTFTKRLEHVIKTYNQDSKPFVEKGKKASKFILSEYSLDGEKEDIKNVWENILK